MSRFRFGDEWADFEAQVFEDDDAPAERWLAQTSFFAGAMAVLMLLDDLGECGMSADFCDEVACRIEDEVGDFIEAARGGIS